MPVQPPTQLFTFFGFVIWGDFAELTMYRRPDGRLVLFSKTWPDKPPSPLQTAERLRLTFAAQAWQQLTPAKKKEWDTATKRASLCMNGYNLYVHWHYTGDTPAIRTIERASETNLIP